MTEGKSECSVLMVLMWVQLSHRVVSVASCLIIIIPPEQISRVFSNIPWGLTLSEGPSNLGVNSSIANFLVNCHVHSSERKLSTTYQNISECQKEQQISAKYSKHIFQHMQIFEIIDTLWLVIAWFLNSSTIEIMGWQFFVGGKLSCVFDNV